MDVNKMLADIQKQICKMQELLGISGFTNPAWFVTGNLNVNDDQFLGSINDADLIFKTTDTERARITKVGLFGIGTNSPTTTFDINGQIRIRGGSPGAGKVLQSDANGVGTWVAPTTFSMAANNGLSISGGNAVLGQDLGDILNPAILLSHREIPTNNNFIFWTGTGTRQSIAYPDTSVVPFTTLDIMGTLGVSQGLNYPTSGLQGNSPARVYVVHGNGNYGLNVTRAGVNQNPAHLSLFRTHGATADIRTLVPAGNQLGRVTFQTVTGNLSVNIASSFLSGVADTTNVAFSQGYFGITTTGPDGGQTTIKFLVSPIGNVTIGGPVGTDSGGGGFDPASMPIPIGESDGSKLRIMQRIVDGANSYNGIHLTTTWNTTGIPTALKVNVTDTASDTNSLLADIQLGGLSRFKVTKTITDIAGQIAVRGGSPGAGKVLTSDAAGLATWQTAPGILTGANTGLSVVSGIIQLGQSVGAAGDPALISTTRQIPLTDSGLVILTNISNASLIQSFNASSHTIQGTSTVSPAVQLLNITNSKAITLNWNNTLGVYQFVFTDGLSFADDIIAQGNIGIGQNNPTAKLHIIESTSSDTTTTGILLQRVNGGAIGGVGLGIDILFRAENDTSSITDAGKISAYWTDATTGTENSSLDFWTTTAGTSNSKMSIRSTGNVLIGGTVDNGSRLQSYATGANNAIYGSTSTGRGVYGVASGAGGTGVYGEASFPTGFAVQAVASGNVNPFKATSENAIPVWSELNNASTTGVAILLQLAKRTTGTAANGIGAAIDFTIENDSGGAQNVTLLSSVLTDVVSATQTAKFTVQNKYNGTLQEVLSIAGSGAVTLTKYTVDAFPGVPVNSLSVDSTGNIIQAPVNYGRNAQSGTTYTIVLADIGKIIGLSNTAARTITLVAANSVPAGYVVWFKDEAGTASTGNITINRVGADTIDGATSVVINQDYQVKGLYSDGASAWFVV